MSGNEGTTTRPQPPETEILQRQQEAARAARDTRLPIQVCQRLAFLKWAQVARGAYLEWPANPDGSLPHAAPLPIKVAPRVRWQTDAAAALADEIERLAALVWADHQVELKLRYPSPYAVSVILEVDGAHIVSHTSRDEALSLDEILRYVSLRAGALIHRQIREERS